MYVLEVPRILLSNETQVHTCWCPIPISCISALYISSPYISLTTMTSIVLTPLHHARNTPHPDHITVCTCRQDSRHQDKEKGKVNMSKLTISYVLYIAYSVQYIYHNMIQSFHANHIYSSTVLTPLDSTRGQ